MFGSILDEVEEEGFVVGLAVDLNSVVILGFSSGVSSDDCLRVADFSLGPFFTCDPVNV